MVSPPKEIEMEDVVLFLLRDEELDAVTQVNQLKVDSWIVQANPPMDTLLPFQASTLLGKPVPVTLTVVPPPMLPSEGSLEMMLTWTVCWS